MSKTKIRRLASSFGALFFILLFSLGPLYWALLNSFKNRQQLLLARPTALLPHIDHLTFQHYITIFSQYNFGRYFVNSFIIALGATALVMIVAIPAAYSFARLEFRGKKPLFWITIIAITFPWITLMIPIVDLYRQLNLYDTYFGVILVSGVTTLPLALWLLRDFFEQSIDKNLEDSARIDGCSLVGAFFRVILPLTKPAIGAVSIFSFLTAWNIFIWPFILTSDTSKRTATVALHLMMGSDVQQQWGAMLAGLVVLTIPPVVIFGFLQKYMVEEMTLTGGVKE